MYIFEEYGAFNARGVCVGGGGLWGGGGGGGRHNGGKNFRYPFNITWGAPSKNASSGICRQRRPRSACVSAQSDQDLFCPLTESLGTTECQNR